MTIRLVALADTHCYQQGLEVPDGDIFVHGGDLTHTGTYEELEQSRDWITMLPHEHKIVIAGNHDWLFQLEPLRARNLFEAVTYLEDEAVEILGLKFWGSPWQPEFFNWAFNLKRGEPLAEVWKKIPDSIDVLITHGPPRGYGDRVGQRREGCDDLLNALQRVQPALHMFGHIHEDRGQWRVGPTLVANVTTAEATLAATVFDLERVDGVWVATILGGA